NKQKTALKTVGFMKNRGMTMVEKLEDLEADKRAATGERLDELAEELENSIQTHVEAQYGIGVEQP
uniref:Rop family plasmid primer RNA-binding protein n=1 Tax=Salmonella enterica TaxID=28901 RepID=UPI00398C348D